MTQADQQTSDSALEAKTEPVREPSFHSFPDCALFAQVMTDLIQCGTRGRSSSVASNLGSPESTPVPGSYLLRECSQCLAKGMRNLDLNLLLLLIS